MFKCDFCGKISPAGTRCAKIRTEFRKKEYQFRSRANVAKNEEGRKVLVPDQGGKGIETVKELKACIHCAPSAVITYST